MKKAINAALILVFGALAVAVQDGGISMVEWFAIVLAALRGVLGFPPIPRLGQFGVYLPLVITAAIGGISQLIIVLNDGGGLSAFEWVSALVVFLSALGSTYQTPEAAVSDALRGGANSVRAPQG